MKKPEDPDSLLEQLRSTATAKRRSAAKKLGALGIRKAGKPLLEALSKELVAGSWETKVRMIDALGRVGYKPAAKLLLEICTQNLPHDRVTSVAATAYVRLTRKNLRDAAPILALLEFADYSVACGALDTLGYDRMMPSSAQIALILKRVRDYTPHPGTVAPAFGVAVAAAGWKGDHVRQFLEECLKSPDETVVRVATASLQGEYAPI